MKKYLLLIAALVLGMTTYAAEIDANKIGDYHRSTLLIMPVVHMQDSFAAEVAEATKLMPFPDRYDRLQGTEEVDMLVRLDNHCDLKQVKDTSMYYKMWLEVLNSQNIAKQMVATWFNFDEEKGFNTEYLAERGHYDASALSQELAAGTISGEVNIADAGDELIGKTFLLVNDMAYIDHAARAQLVSDYCDAISAWGQSAQDTGDELANTNTGVGAIDALFSLAGAASSIVGAVADLGASLTKSANELLQIEGFAVLECTYLYQLDWSPEVQNIFYSKYYTETGDAAKIAAFMADTTSFKLKFVGQMPTITNNATAFHAGKYANLSQEEQITITCSRTQDDAINNLQSKFEDFRVYTPITEVIYNKKNAVVGIVAPIGLKEGVAANKKYSIMQCTLKKNGRTVYTLVDNVKVAPKAEIWDNRYAAQQEGVAEQAVKGTQFATKKNVIPGFLLIETTKKQKK